MKCCSQPKSRTQKQHGRYCLVSFCILFYAVLILLFFSFYFILFIWTILERDNANNSVFENLSKHLDCGNEIWLCIFKFSKAWFLHLYLVTLFRSKLTTSVEPFYKPSIEHLPLQISSFLSFMARWHFL